LLLQIDKDELEAEPAALGDKCGADADRYYIDEAARAKEEHCSTTDHHD
jgi:hypothetical protein